MLDKVLEQKVAQKNVTINGDEVSRVCSMIGIMVGDKTDGCQPHYSKKYITLAVWTKQEISLERLVITTPKDINNNLSSSR